MKKILIISLLMIISVGVMISQTTFAKVYDIFHPGNEEALCLFQINNGYFVTGHGGESLFGHHPLNFYTYNIDKKGDLINQNYSKHFSHESPYSIYKEGKDIYMVISNQKQVQDYNTRLYIYHTNENGDSLGMIRINHEDSIYLENKGIVKVGEKFYLLNYILRDITKELFYDCIRSHLIEVNQKGEIEFEKEFDYLYTPESLNLIDSSKLVLFQHYRKTGDEIVNINNFAVIDVFDTLGNNIVHNEIEYPRNSISIPHLVIANDNNYVLNLSSESSSHKIYNFIVKIDSAGNQKWRYDFNDKDTIGLKENRKIGGIYAAKNGDILGFGMYDKYSIDFEDTISIYVPFIFRIDSGGKLKWEHFLYEDLDNIWFGAHFNTIIEDSLGEIILVGDYLPYNQDTLKKDNKYFSFVVKLDSTGCFKQECDENVVLEINWVKTIDALFEQNIKQLKISPNPASTFIKIDLPQEMFDGTWEIYNFEGKKVCKGRIGNRNQITISEIGALQNGIYFVLLRNSSGKRSVGKFVVER